MEYVVKLSQNTVGYLDNINEECPAKYIVKDVANFLNIKCDSDTTSLKDLGVKYCYLDRYEKLIVIKL